MRDRLFKNFARVLLLSSLGASLVTSYKTGYKLCKSQVCKEAGKLITENIKQSVNPCDDFYEHACGGWVEKNLANEELASYTQINKLDDIVISQLKELLETYNASDIEAVRKAKNLYHSCVDIRAIDDRGISPLKSMVSNNGGWPLTIPSKFWNLKSHNLTLQSIYETYIKMGAHAPLFRIHVKRDEKNPNDHIVSIYTQPTAESRWRYYSEKRSKRDIEDSAYEHYIKGVVEEFVGNDEIESDTITEDLENMLKFEMALEAFDESLSQVPQQTTIEELQKSWDTARSDYAINWLEIIRSHFVGTGIAINATEKIEIPSGNFVQEFVNILKNTNFRTIVNYIQWFEIDAFLSFTNKKMRDVTDEFSRKTVGLEAIGDRTTFCLKQNQMLHAWSYMYVQKYFSKERLDTITDMVSNIQSEMKREIDELSWMDDDAKIQSKEKIDSMVKHIGYPSWYDEVGKIDEYYDKLKIGKKFFENILNIKKFQQMRAFSDLRKTFKETKFEIPAVKIDSDYIAERNLLDYPAVFFQMPIFHHNLPIAMQYGGMGSAIANEIVKGFYYEGREFDKYGNKKQLWANSTVAKFNEKAECFVQQFSNYVLLKDDNNSTVYVDGHQTEQTNIADTTGFSIGLKAYLAYRKEHGSKDVRIPGLTYITDEQLFFYSLANPFCASYTPTFTIDVAVIVNSVRISGALSNINEFGKAFNCPIGSRMNPEKKCSI